MMLRIVLDTNVLLVSVPDRSRLHWVYQALLQERFVLCVTTEILAEYAEILTSHSSQAVSNNVMEVMQSAPNVALITPYYRFNLLADPDDNKFVDCAIAAGAYLLVTHDRDFDVLRKIAFPPVRVGDTRQLAALLNP